MFPQEHLPFFLFFIIDRIIKTTIAVNIRHIVIVERFSVSQSIDFSFLLDRGVDRDVNAQSDVYARFCMGFYATNLEIVYCLICGSIRALPRTPFPFCSAKRISPRDCCEATVSTQTLFGLRPKFCFAKPLIAEKDIGGFADFFLFLLLFYLTFLSYQQPPHNY